MIKRTVIILAVLLTSFSVFAQQRTITVIGEAELANEADQAVFDFMIGEKGKSLDDAYNKAQKKAAEIVTQFVAAGIDSASLQQSKLQIDDTGYELFSENRKYAVIKIRASINNMKLVSRALSILNDFKVGYIRDIELVLSQEQEMKEKCLALAIENAKKGAQTAAKSNLLVLGDIISIEEVLEEKEDKSDGQDGFWEPFYSSRYFAMEESRVQTKLLSEKIKIKKRVKVTFELK